jgi:hypothetical protein
MSDKRINEGLGDIVSNIGGAIKTDIMKNSGPWISVVDSLLKNPKQHEHEMNKDFADYATPEFQRFQNAANQFSKRKKGKDINAVIKYIKGLKDTDDLAKFYKWRFYFDTMGSNGKDKVQVEKSKQRIVANIVKDVDQSTVPIDASHWGDIEQFVDKMIIEEVNRNRSTYDSVVLKTKKKPATKTAIPETKETNMSFKSFNEKIEKKLKEDNVSSLQAKDAQDAKKVADAQMRAATTKSKLTQAQLQAQKKAADVQAKQAKQGIPVAEGVYAGGDGVAKKIPFTQNPTLQVQAVGPKDGAKDETVEDDETKASKERKKKLDDLSKELQDLADESNGIAKDNIDATEDNLIDKMAAKEQKDLKESKVSWAEMEKKLKQLDEGCVGGVCTMGGRSDAAGGPVGNWGIAPIGSVGQLSMPPGAPQNVAQVADRSSIYSFIKDNDLMRTSRDYALNTLLGQFGNSSTELSQILSDAILSDGNPTDIDSSYGYASDSLLPVSPDQDAPPEDFTQDRESTQDQQMKAAWGQMESKLADL